MTEIPEHLLARSRSRRAALGLGGDDAAPAAAAPAAASESAPAATTAAAPAVAAATGPVEVAAPPAPPVPAYVAAAESRKKIPIWVMPVLLFLPVWAILYAQSLSAPPSTKKTQLAAGAEVYSQCAGCHGATGGGGAGRPFANGEVLKTFPNIANQLEFVKNGSAGFQNVVYGNPNREGGPHVGGSFGNMPAFKASLTDAELLEVVRHERETLGGEKDVKMDAEGNREWPNGKPMLDASGKLIGPDGQPLFNAESKLATPVDASQPPAAG